MNKTIEIGDVVRLRAGKVRWEVVEIVGDRAYLESASAFTEPLAKLSDLSLWEGEQL